MMTAFRLLRYDDLLAAGYSSRAVTAAVSTKRLVRLRPGVYVDGSKWTAATPESRLVARARALDLVSSARPVFSHQTAAAIHGLALYRADCDRVHVIAPRERPGAASGVVRHRAELPYEEVQEVSGLWCASVARTVADVARTATFEQAVTIADAALREMCVPRAGEYLHARAQEFRDTALAITRRSAHGKTRAQRALAFADGRAQLPGESVSRIRLRELGFQGVDLQVEVAGPRSSHFYVDFGFHDIRSFGEFDGSMKYVDGRLTDGRTTAEVFDREKQREDWIRGTTQYRYARWGWPHMGEAKALGARLSAFGIRPPR
jgi:hypothetical protein